MLFDSKRLVYVTSTFIVCRGVGVDLEIDGKVGLVVCANPEEFLYRVKVEDTGSNVCTVMANCVTTIFVGEE